MAKPPWLTTPIAKIGLGHGGKIERTNHQSWYPNSWSEKTCKWHARPIKKYVCQYLAIASFSNRKFGAPVGT